MAGQAGRTILRKLPRLTPARIAILLATLVVGYFLFAAAGDTLLSQRLSQHEQELQQEIADLQRQQSRLEAIREYLRTDEYIEGVARRVLGLVRPGETLVIVTSSATPVPTEGMSEETQPGRWWEQLFGP